MARRIWPTIFVHYTLWSLEPSYLEHLWVTKALIDYPTRWRYVERLTRICWRQSDIRVKCRWRSSAFTKHDGLCGPRLYLSTASRPPAGSGKSIICITMLGSRIPFYKLTKQLNEKSKSPNYHCNWDVHSNSFAPVSTLVAAYFDTTVSAVDLLVVVVTIAGQNSVNRHTCIIHSDKMVFLRGVIELGGLYRHLFDASFCRFALMSFQNQRFSTYIPARYS